MRVDHSASDEPHPPARPAPPVAGVQVVDQPGVVEDRQEPEPRVEEQVEGQEDKHWAEEQESGHPVENGEGLHPPLQRKEERRELHAEYFIGAGVDWVWLVVSRPLIFT